MIIISALLGLALCLFSAAGVEFFCVTDGCAIYAGLSLFGVSFYSIGAAGFAAILILALVAGKKERARSLLFWTILAGLLLDMVLLAWQLLYWPCSTCLVVALLLAGTGVGFRLRFPRWHRWLLKGALLGWLVLLIPSAVAVGKEVLVTPWPIYGSPDADIQVYFSPTCPACSSEVEKLLKSDELKRMVFYPVAKDERDARLVATLLQQGVAEARDLLTLFAIEPDPSIQPSAGLRWQLARNKMLLARYGARTIPFIVSPTVVRMAPPAINPLPSPADPFDAFGPQGCGLFGASDLSCE